MNSRVTRGTVFFLMLLCSCRGSVQITGDAAIPATEPKVDVTPTKAQTGPTPHDFIGTVSNMRTQVHAGARDDLKLIEGKVQLESGDFVSVTDGGKARLEFPGPIRLLLFNMTEVDRVTLETDENSNPRIVKRLIRGGYLGYVEPGKYLTVDLPHKVKVNVLGTNFFIIYDEDNDLITIGKFDGTLNVSVPGQRIVELEDSELVDITSDGTTRHYSPLSFTPSQFEEMADSCSSPIQGINILRRDNELPLPGEAAADKNKELPCGSSSQTPTPTPTKTPTKTPTPRLTPSPTEIPPSIGVPELSTRQLYYRGTSCDPSRITIRVAAEHRAGIKVVVFFHRLHEINTGKDSGWSDGLSMNTMGGDIYNLSVSGDTLIGNSGLTAEARVSYQFIIQAQNGELTRSAVYSDLSLLPCGSRPPRTPSPITVTPITPSACIPGYCYATP
jgi:hypothetical protein